MARPLRIELEGSFYHITSRGNEKKPIFLDDQDRIELYALLSKAHKRYGFIFHAHCLMGNHYHLLIETPLKNLSIGMRQINGEYAQRFNRKYHREGHLFQDRFKSIVIEQERYFLVLARYIVLNPVRACIVDSPEKWKWSSFSETAGLKQEEEFSTSELILSQFSTYYDKARIQYQKYILEGIGEESPLRKVKGGFILGENPFTEKIMRQISPQNKIDVEYNKKSRTAWKPSLDEIFSNHGRNEGITIAVNRHQYCLKEVGQYLGLHFSTISRISRKSDTKK